MCGLGQDWINLQGHEGRPRDPLVNNSIIIKKHA